MNDGKQKLLYDDFQPPDKGQRQRWRKHDKENNIVELKPFSLIVVELFYLRTDLTATNNYVHYRLNPRLFLFNYLLGL